MSETLFEEVREDAAAHPDYQPVSGLAVAGFFLGWLSMAAFFSSVLWTVAGIGIVLNLAALRHVAVTSRKGAGLARGGLALSALFLSAAVAERSLHDYLTLRQAQRVADQLVEALLSGDVRLAYQLTREPAQRQMGLEQTHGVSHSRAVTLQAFSTAEAVKRVVELGRVNSAQVSSAQPLDHLLDSYAEVVLFQYDLVYDDQGEKVHSLKLRAKRDRKAALHVASWRIEVEGVDRELPGKTQMPDKPPGG